MLLLALDTSAATVAVAVHDGTGVVAETAQEAPRGHGELLAPAVAGALDAAGVRPAQLTAVAVGVGPGPFTGLRVGLATARVLGAALGVEVYGVCSLDVLAAEALASGTVDGPFAVAGDARRREVYRAVYDAAGRRTGGPHVLRPADLPDAARALPTVGQGALLHGLPDARPPWLPGAGTLAEMVVRALAAGPGGDAACPGAVAAPGVAAVLLPPDPLYLRRPDAAVPGPPKPVTPPPSSRDRR